MCACVGHCHHQNLPVSNTPSDVRDMRTPALVEEYVKTKQRDMVSTSRQSKTAHERHCAVVTELRSRSVID